MTKRHQDHVRPTVVRASGQHIGAVVVRPVVQLSNAYAVSRLSREATWDGKRHGTCPVPRMRARRSGAVEAYAYPGGRTAS